MIDHYFLDTPAIIIMADRGYDSYNLFAHLFRSGQKFVIRLKDNDRNEIITTYKFPYNEKGEFDCYIETVLA
ncbi:MAG: transposase [Blautia sp.]|nr:transposase [Blautia sp.]